MRYFRVTRTYLVALPDEINESDRNLIWKEGDVNDPDDLPLTNDTEVCDAVTRLVDAGDLETTINDLDRAGDSAFDTQDRDVWGGFEHSTQIEQTNDYEWAVF